MAVIQLYRIILKMARLCSHETISIALQWMDFQSSPTTNNKSLHNWRKTDVVQ